MDALISVIIPAYNIAEYLPKTLDSIRAQSYQKLEIIVVNDGSTDDTGKVIDAYAAVDSRIKGIHKKNGGVTSARLTGLSVAAGQFVGFVDGDDYIEPTMYEQLMDNLNSYGADISHCGYQRVFPDGRSDYYYNTGRIVVQKGKQGCADLLEGRFVEPGLCNKLYRRELFYGLEDWIDTSIRINEDLLMNFFLFRQAKIAVFEDICPYHYQMRRGSASTSRINEHSLKDPLRVQHRLYQETANDPQLNTIVERRLMYQLVSCATQSLGDQRALIKPFRKETRKELRQRLFMALTGSSCGIKLKMMVLWASIWPASYGWIHRLYAKVTGADKKYDVE